MIVEGGKTFDIRLIPQTCNREEAIREIVGALDHLQAISEEIFSTIHKRLHDNRKHVEALTARISAASEQVSNLKGAQKAIRIVSPAKYPCEISNDDGTSSDAGNTLEQLTLPTLVSKHIPSPRPLGLEDDSNIDDNFRRPFRFDTAIKHPNDLLSIFHVKEPMLGDLSQLDNVADVGLGKPPTTVTNMDSFFLFNSIDNPYQNYKMTERSLQDRNFGLMKPARKGEEVQGDECPTVNTEDGAETKTDVDDFYYNPSALDIPDIDVPECLPNLPGIADSFDLKDEVMSPSFMSKPFTLSSVPTPSSKQAPPISDAMQDDDDDFFDVTRRQPESLSAFHLPPSPPKSSATPSSSVLLSPPPPPPPPPPMAAPPKEETKPASSSAPPPAAGGGDLRSSLMAAIREAGGSGKARLKSAQDRKYEAKKKKQDEKEKNISNELQDGNDLMADLKNTLAMRRRGISGIPDGQNRVAGVGDIMQSLAATIPSFEDLDSSGGGGVGGSDDDDWG